MPCSASCHREVLARNSQVPGSGRSAPHAVASLWHCVGRDGGRVVARYCRLRAPGSLRRRSRPRAPSRCPSCRRAAGRLCLLSWCSTWVAVCVCVCLGCAPIRGDICVQAIAGISRHDSKCFKFDAENSDVVAVFSRIVSNSTELHSVTTAGRAQRANRARCWASKLGSAVGVTNQKWRRPARTCESYDTHTFSGVNVCA